MILARWREGAEKKRRDERREAEEGEEKGGGYFHLFIKLIYFNV
jgi:hypothetical protein